MSWIKIEHGLCRNKKVARLAARMNWTRHQTIGFLTDFWIWAAQSADDGQLAGYSDWEIAFAVGLEKTDGILEAMKEAGFVDREPCRIHEWPQHQYEFLRSKYRRSPDRFRRILSFYPELELDCTGAVPVQDRTEDGATPVQDRDCHGISKQASKQEKQEKQELPAEEPQAAPPQEPEAEPVGIEVGGNPLVDFPLPGTGTYTVMDTHLSDWQAAYPAIDIKAELAKMRVWLLENPKNRKTIKGIPRFIASWLGRAQDRAAKFPAVKKEQNFEGW